MKQHKWIISLVVMMLVLAACAQQPGDGAADASPVPQDGITLPPVEQAPGGPVTPASCEVLPQEDLTGVPTIPLSLETDYVYGNPDAPVSVIEYSELQCPYCAQFEPVMTALEEAHGEDVRIVFRHFPLISIHDKAQLGAQALEAAALQDPAQFNALKNSLFEKQAEWAEKTVDEFETYLIDEAKALGLDTAQFTTDLKAAETVARVDASRESGMEYGVQGTPTVFIDGFQYQGNRDVESIWAMVEAIQAAKEEYGEEYINALPHVGLAIPEDVKNLVDTYEDLLAKYGEEGLKKYPLSLAQNPAIFDTIIGYVDLQERAYTSCPEVIIDRTKQYFATVETTQGEFVIELYPDQAPTTVNSFVFLAQDGWFDNVPFHRVIPGFVAQTGDPSGTGLGSPGYAFGNEANNLKFDKAGMVGMANSGPDTNGSQFFIGYDALPQLDGGYTVFGQVTEGMDVVEKLTPRDPQQGPDLAEPDRILSISIEEK